VQEADLRALAARLAAEDVEEVIARAREDTRASVRAVLAKAMSEALLEAAAAPPPVPAEQGLGWYVFCVVRDGALDLPGTELVREGDLAAVVTRVPLQEYGEAALRENLNDIAWLEDAARRHEAVLDQALAVTTVIPMRLCTIYRDEDAVRGMLATEHDGLADALDRLAGHTEWGVKAFACRDAEVSAERFAGLSEGEAYLARKRARLDAREQADELVRACVEDAHARLSELAAEALVNPLQSRELTGREEAMVHNGVYLVEDAASDAFRAAVDELCREHGERGVELELTGPWPPYNFVGRSVEAAR
jgi:hypothetical protein